jgi:hypothetical protein
MGCSCGKRHDEFNVACAEVSDPTDTETGHRIAAVAPYNEDVFEGGDLDSAATKIAIRRASKNQAAKHIRTVAFERTDTEEDLGSTEDLEMVRTASHRLAARKASKDKAKFAQRVSHGAPQMMLLGRPPPIVEQAGVSLESGSMEIATKRSISKNTVDSEQRRLTELAVKAERSSSKSSVRKRNSLNDLVTEIDADGARPPSQSSMPSLIGSPSGNTAQEMTRQCSPSIISVSSVQSKNTAGSPKGDICTRNLSGPGVGQPCDP